MDEYSDESIVSSSTSSKFEKEEDKNIFFSSSINISPEYRAFGESENDRIVSSSSSSKETDELCTRAENLSSTILRNALLDPKKERKAHTPPITYCVICRDIASGSHYGLISCDACKSFFSQCVDEDIVFKKCFRNCTVSRLTRNRCQFCRFKKCLDLGMSSQDLFHTPRMSFVSLSSELITKVKFAFQMNCPYTTQRISSSSSSSSYIPKFRYSTHLESSSSFNLKEEEDKRRSYLWSQLMTAIDPSIEKVVEFSKQIPGFLNLVQDDQLILIKYGFFPVWLLWASHLTEKDSQDFLQILRHILGNSSLASNIFNFWKRVSSLTLSSSEIGVFTAVLLLESRCIPLSFTNPQIISVLRNNVSTALNDLLIQTNRSTLSKYLWDLQREVARLEIEHRDCLDWLRERNDNLDIPILWSEIFDISPSEEEYPIVSSSTLN